MVVTAGKDQHTAISSISPRGQPSLSKSSLESSVHDIEVVDGVLKISDYSTARGVSRVLRLAKENPQLEVLDLSGCNISKGDELAETMRSCPNLRRLVLEWNSLGLAKTGVSAFSAAIACNSTLKEVDLRSNRIGPTTAAALAHALRNNCSLTSLDLRWNEIGPTGATAFIGMLERNRTLIDLQLAGNNIPTSLQAEIDALLERNRTGEIQADFSSSYSPRQYLDLDRRADGLSNEKRRANLQSELSKLRNNLEMLKEECHSLRLQKEATDSHLECIKNELKEESLLRKHLEKEGLEYKEQAMKAKEDIVALEEKLYSDNNTQNAILMEAQDMHSAVLSQCQALQDEILRLREEHSAELRSLAERAGKEADCSVALMNRMDVTLREHDQLYMDEINRLQSQLSLEIQARQDALRELERQKSLALAAEQSRLQEKDAHQQTLANLMAVNAELKSVQSEVEKLMKQLSKTKKMHAAELQEYEDAIAYHKQQSARTEQIKSEFSAERHDKEKQNGEREIQNLKDAVELCQRELQEMQTDQEQRKFEINRKLQDAEAVISNAVHQKFGDLRNGTGPQTSSRSTKY